MKSSADLTRSPRHRAGSRRNKRLKNVGTQGSDSKFTRRMPHDRMYQTAGVKKFVRPPRELAVLTEDHRWHFHVKGKRSVDNTRVQSPRKGKIRLARG